jgi:hypothetical protein
MTVDVAELLGDLIEEQLASKGRGQHLDPLAENVWRRLVDRLVAADPRFVRSPGAMIELAHVRDQRHAAITRGPTTVDGPEPDVAAERYVVPSLAGSHDSTGEEA